MINALYLLQQESFLSTSHNTEGFSSKSLLGTCPGAIMSSRMLSQEKKWTTKYVNLKLPKMLIVCNIKYDKTLELSSSSITGFRFYLFDVTDSIKRGNPIQIINKKKFEQRKDSYKLLFRTINSILWISTFIWNCQRSRRGLLKQFYD